MGGACICVPTKVANDRSLSRPWWIILRQRPPLLLLVLLVMIPERNCCSRVEEPPTSVLFGSSSLIALSTKQACINRNKGKREEELSTTTGTCRSLIFHIKGRQAAEFPILSNFKLLSLFPSFFFYECIKHFISSSRQQARDCDLGRQLLPPVVSFIGQLNELRNCTPQDGSDLRLERFTI